MSKFRFLILKAILLSTLGVQIAVASSDDCPQSLSRLHGHTDEILELNEDDVRLVDELVSIADDIELLQTSGEFDVLFNFSVPQVYGELNSTFIENRKQASDILLNHYKKVRLNKMLSIPSSAEMPLLQKLEWLAKQYELGTTPEEKAIPVNIMLKMFSISVENIYMIFLRESDSSKEVKRDLYTQLEKKFGTDPSWLSPLRNARTAGRF
jgi:hypothetical protein